MVVPRAAWKGGQMEALVICVEMTMCVHLDLCPIRRYARDGKRYPVRLCEEKRQRAQGGVRSPGCVKSGGK